MRKLMALGLFLCLMVSTCAFAAEPIINSSGAALYEVETGQFLFQKNGDTPLFPASTTKVLTALIILESSKMTDQVTTPNDFKNPGGSSIAIDHGEIFTVEQLLYSLLLESANDAAALLAIHHSGSIDAFAKVMNDRAKALGAKNSNFTNPHGLHNPKHVSTAKDLALIAAEAMKNPTFRTIVATPKYTLPPTNKKTEARDYIRTNNLFVRDAGVNMTYQGKKIPIYDPTIDGMKTGYTTEANNCLISTKKAGASRLISVILGAGVDNAVFSESKTLLEYGGSDFKATRFVSEGEIVTNIKVPSAENAGLNLVAKATLTRTMAAQGEGAEGIKEVIELAKLPKTPIKRGMVLGTVKYVKGTEVLASTELLAERDVNPGSLLGNITLKLSAKSKFESPIDIAIVVGKVLIAFIIWRWLVTTRNRKARNRQRAAKLKEIRETIAAEVIEVPNSKGNQSGKKNLRTLPPSKK